MLLDWATLGRSPVGDDIARLVLSTGEPALFDEWFEATEHRWTRAHARLGYEITLALTAASRLRWAQHNGVELDVDFVWDEITIW